MAAVLIDLLSDMGSTVLSSIRSFTRFDAVGSRTVPPHSVRARGVLINDRLKPNAQHDQVGFSTVTFVPEGEKPVHRSSVELRWRSVGLMVGGAGVAGFSVAALSGVATTFSQPLATVLAGAGALAAGTLAYVNGQRSRAQEATHHQATMDRERERHQDDSHRARESVLRDRYTAVAAQIAHDSAAIRQAGVYALTALADDWHAFGEDDERQVCINLLQWYLRVPFTISSDSEQPDLSEREIRQTIVGIIAQRRLRPVDDPKSWVSTSISLDRASLPKCHLRAFDLAGLSLRGADLVEASLRVTNLTNADLTGANLTGADLSYTNLTGALLSRANLTGAGLFSANLTGTGLTGADLTGANLTESVNDDTTRWPGAFKPPQ
ncbi:pentapeptide repeat-containing protein [Nocardia sp. NPDC051832]|uniref:pentapeptide repeat-containing protein n=1 Tax=Nocardia sp. NPDC051832 TaxID=3155673 RepID=UPI00342DBAF5